MRVEQDVAFTAVAYDAVGDAVSGIRMKWRARDMGRNHPARISHFGDFPAVAPGTYTVTAEGAGTIASVMVTVLNATRRNNEPPQRILPVSTRDIPSTTSAKLQTSEKTAKSENRGKGYKLSTRSLKLRAHALMPLPGDPGWNDNNYYSADDPGNTVGAPPGAPLDGGAGNANFQLGAPILGLPGRGIDLSLGLAYNSRLWNIAGSQIDYDVDGGWPVPGWSLGFGKLVGMGVYHGSMMIDADGTRHAYSGSVAVYSWGTIFTGHTTDGVQRQLFFLFGRSNCRPSQNM